MSTLAHSHHYCAAVALLFVLVVAPALSQPANIPPHIPVTTLSAPVEIDARPPVPRAIYSLLPMGAATNLAGHTITGKNKDKVIVRPTPGTGIAFTVRSASSDPIHFVVLTQEQAERLTLLEIRGQKTLIYSGAYAFSDGETIHLRSAGRSEIFFGVLSAGDVAWQNGNGLKPQPPEGVFQVYKATVTPRLIAVEFTPTKQAGAAPRVERANPAGWRKQPVALAPTDATLQEFAAQWSITLPKDALAGTEDVFLQIHYEGDVGRLYAGGALIDDNFYNGEPWVIGLKRFATRLDAPLQLQILPLRDDAPVYFDSGYKPQFGGKQTAGVASIAAVPEYELVLRPEPIGVPKIDVPK
jgi:beta-galactosidase